VANLQVANEFADVVLRKLRHIPPEVVFSLANDILQWGASAVSRTSVRSARALHLEHRYSWWVSLLLASALELGCSHFLSEDLQDGQVIGGLTIVDPFAHSPEQILLPSP
jgi:predicted nucleic acid-binding protein